MTKADMVRTLVSTFAAGFCPDPEDVWKEFLRLGLPPDQEDDFDAAWNEAVEIDDNAE